MLIKINDWTEMSDIFGVMGKGEEFSTKGFKALFDYIEESGEDYILDAIELSKKFTEYDDLEDFNNRNNKNYRNIEDITTEIIRIDKNKFIAASI